MTWTISAKAETPHRGCPPWNGLPVLMMAGRKEVKTMSEREKQAIVNLAMHLEKLPEDKRNEVCAFAEGVTMAIGIKAESEEK